jgi:hypothetical protein
MGTTTSKTPKTPFNSAEKRASKRILKRNSTIYPSTVPCNDHVENNNNSSDMLLNNSTIEEVVIRNHTKNVEEITPKSAKKEKKKKKSESAVSGDENVLTYHQTNICYYKVESGKFLKLPNNTKHKSGSCYVKVSNGSFRQFLNVSDGTGSQSEISFKAKDSRQSMPVQKLSDREKNDDKQPQNRKIMVTMLDGGALPVVAVSKRERASNPIKKDKEKSKVKVWLKLFFECMQERV